MRQKDIYWADLEPVTGREQGGKRPVVIISGNTLNQYLDIVIICPLSSHIKNYENNVILKNNKRNKLKNDSEIITFQVRAISKKRLKEKIGEITTEELEAVFVGLRDNLAY